MTVKEDVLNPISMSSTQLHHAQVYAVERGRVGVVHTGGCFWLSVAVSCLVQPEVGDMVLVSQGKKDGYVLAVLTRSKSQQVTVQLPDNSRVVMGAGMLTIDVHAGIALQSESTISVATQRYSQSSEQASVQAAELDISGQIKKENWFKTQEQIQQQHIKLESRITQVAGHDEAQVGSQRLIVAKEWRVRSKTSDIRAEQLLSMDAKRIQIA